MKKPEKEAKSDKVTISKSFAAVAVRKPDGNMTLRVKSRDYYQHNLNEFRNGENVTIEIHTKKQKRTIAQNRYYFGVYLPLIATETGQKDVAALHEYFAMEFLKRDTVRVFDREITTRKSTADLSIGEFCEFILAIEARTEIEAPPTENYGLEPLK